MAASPLINEVSPDRFSRTLVAFGSGEKIFVGCRFEQHLAVFHFITLLKRKIPVLFFQTASARASESSELQGLDGTATDENTSQHAWLVTYQDDGSKALTNKYVKTNRHFPGRTALRF